MNREGLLERIGTLSGAAAQAKRHEPASTILVVDDDKQVLRSLVLVLRQKYNVVTTADPEEGARMALDPDVSLVVLDVKMPGRDGVWVYDEIRKSSAVPIIFNTAYQDPRSLVEIERRVGPEGIFSKGARLGEFLGLIERRLRPTGSCLTAPE